MNLKGLLIDFPSRLLFFKMFFKDKAFKLKRRPYPCNLTVTVFCIYIFLPESTQTLREWGRL